MNQTNIITEPTNTTEPEPFTPKLKRQSYLEICVDDAMYNAPYEVMIQHNKGTEYCGWGLERPDHFTVSYQRLWEYYVNKEIYMDAVIADYKLTGVVPNLNPIISGVGFEFTETVGEEYEN